MDNYFHLIVDSTQPNPVTGWLERGRILSALQLVGGDRGRRADVTWLEARAENEGGKIDREAMEAILRRKLRGGAGGG